MRSFIWVGAILCALGCAAEKQNRRNNNGDQVTQQPTGKDQPEKPQPPLTDPTPGADMTCAPAPATESEHQVQLTTGAKPDDYRIDFVNAADRKLRIVGIYVTGRNDEIPTFINRFKFTGTAYWMISMDKPFDEYFTLPLAYGELPPQAMDITQRYGGKANGMALRELQRPTCLKFSVITFEPDLEPSFRSSVLMHLHQP